MIGIIVAMGAEFRLTEALLEHKRESTVGGFRFLQGKIGEQEIVVMQSGIGKVCAAAGTMEMITCLYSQYRCGRRDRCFFAGDGYGGRQRSYLSRCLVW